MEADTISMREATELFGSQAREAESKRAALFALCDDWRHQSEEWRSAACAACTALEYAMKWCRERGGDSPFMELYNQAIRKRDQAISLEEQP